MKYHVSLTVNEYKDKLNDETFWEKSKQFSHFERDFSKQLVVDMENYEFWEETDGDYAERTEQHNDLVFSWGGLVAIGKCQFIQLSSGMVNVL